MAARTETARASHDARQAQLDDPTKRIEAHGIMALTGGVLGSLAGVALKSFKANAAVAGIGALLGLGASELLVKKNTGHW